ncbi:hypothetical protein BU24DRAFT_22456 [Aaosphaeria arxii CBS 175.79]|uniref:Uncharacterized protein n=1 Tax=Aaosphaeria arxii CBS 175.79 TaxID=1450172 RepID=A0A6A5Y965_9PLEO|nr:uncharacterized protein BU24DRAFT_22456 [Aaosphaeria arxii CBS 175.79]KAF2021547.1 hypothetical protein BU24DRAFT_22456 [Aaosphaeria arxii CBS 175.79]
MLRAAFQKQASMHCMRYLPVVRSTAWRGLELRVVSILVLCLVWSIVHMYTVPPVVTAVNGRVHDVVALSVGDTRKSWCSAVQAYLARPRFTRQHGCQDVQTTECTWTTTQFTAKYTVYQRTFFPSNEFSASPPSKRE